MPIYEYRCAGCGADFDQLVRASDQPACPFCESTALERKMSAAAVSGGPAGRTSAGSLPMASGGGCCGGGCGCH